MKRELAEKKDTDLLESVKKLVAKGAKLNWADGHGFTPLHLLAMLGGTSRTLKW
jgi:hypothetical protein